MGPLDRIRDHRGAADPPSFARGTAAELVGLIERLSEGTALSPATSAMVLEWMGTNVDQSMVGGGFDIDPLAHSTGLDAVQVRNKTGIDTTVRADVGSVLGRRGRLAYAVIVNWPLAESAPVTEILAAMRMVGASIRDSIAATPAARQ